MIDKRIEIAKALHFPLWIVKDGAWFFGFGWVSLIAAIPTLFLSFYIALTSKGLERWEWIMVGMWLLSNSFWMASERFDHEFAHTAKIFWIVSFSILPFYLMVLKKAIK